MDAYASSKINAELEINKICANSNMDFVILRPPLVYGPGVKANFLSILNAVKKGYPLPLSSINNLRSLIYVGNLAHAIFTCIERSDVANKTYMISDTDISVPELIKKIAYHMDKDARLFNCPVSLLKSVASIVGNKSLINRVTDSLLVDSSRFRQELDWEPPYNLDEGISETIDWYCNGS
jgi:nucleoside-diphosphate-sugar epimerase